MEDIIRVKDVYYIRANSSLAEERVNVLKDGDMFAVFNQDGNIRPFGFENHGLYFEGTRFLSRYVFQVDKKHPLLLSSTVREENELMTVDFSNPDLIKSENKVLAKDQVHFMRSCFLKQQVLHERICVSNFSLEPIEISFGFDFDADYSDIFEVRGMERKQRGEEQEAKVTEDSVELGYMGLDQILRRTCLKFIPRPSLVQQNRVEFSLTLQPKEHKDFFISVGCSACNGRIDIPAFRSALEDLRQDHFSLHDGCCKISTSNERFNAWINRSEVDLFMMLTDTGEGLYPYAGIPWFSTVFGRDGIITAMESLWTYPQIAKGVLKYLAAHQANEFIPESDAEPGKILHEVRKGEMVNLKEIPFGNYYGSIDSTLLFMILAGYYFQRTGDAELIGQIWPNLSKALDWAYKYGDRDGDGFIEYERKATGGLSQQGWKDSQDSVFHSSGELADPPIALCEVQAYLYEAKKQMAMLAEVMGNEALSKKISREAAEFQTSFINSFWCGDMNMLALALDGNKRPCRVLSSNAGQCLFSGVLPKQLADKIRDHLMGAHFYSGWGIRTIAETGVRYNPMSYHNGSVWPHDNALIAYGLSRYGFKESVLQVMKGLFEASQFMDIQRLPELFCGFPKRLAEGPTLYPVACNPQAWASAAVFMLLQSCLGLHIDANAGKIYIKKPYVPAYLKRILIRDLAVKDARVDIVLEYDPEDVNIKLVRRKGEVDIVVVK
jgi:glycogen debranching enzyme